jgi:DNA-binding NarL/FixJ family response regulator
MSYPASPILSILIVDRQTLFREGLTLMFRLYENALVSAADFDGAAELGRQLRPHAALFGLPRPSARCWETLKTFREACPQTPVLLLDETVKSDHLREAGTIGVGYWTKEASFREIAQAVRQLVAGQPSFCPEAERRRPCRNP